MSEELLSVEDFQRCIQQICEVSDKFYDGWILHDNAALENGKYLTKKTTISLAKIDNPEEKLTVTIEFHVVFNISYGVPVLCFNIWKQDGSFLSLEEYWKCNSKLHTSNMYETLTQLDHPVLCRPFLTLHPCKTLEVIEPLLPKSKNFVISWLSVIGPYIDLNLLEEYFKYC